VRFLIATSKRTVNDFWFRWYPSTGQAFRVDTGPQAEQVIQYVDTGPHVKQVTRIGGTMTYLHDGADNILAIHPMGGVLLGRIRCEI
jgi:hypothetical protein